MMRFAGVTVVALLGLAGDADADACAPSAVVIGDDGLVRTIEAELRARGVAIAGDAERPTDVTCAVHAEVAPDVDHHIRVTITDSDGRTVERLTADADTAATAIESWARRDMSDPLLAGHAPITPAPAPAPHALDAAALVTPRQRHIEVGAALDSGVSNDGGTWGGVRVRGCAMIGDACLGAQLRYGMDTQQTGDTAMLDNGRDALDLTVTVELPLERDRWSLVPAAGIGQTSLTAFRDVAGEEESEQSSSWHLFAGMAAGRALGGAWRARLDFGVALSPLATERLGENDGVDRQLAALPKARGWLGLGVAYEGL
jgi:hypothetical protein